MWGQLSLLKMEVMQSTCVFIAENGTNANGNRGKEVYSASRARGDLATGMSL